MTFPDDDDHCRCVDCSKEASGKETCGWMGWPQRDSEGMAVWDSQLEWRCPECAERYDLGE